MEEMMELTRRQVVLGVAGAFALVGSGLYLPTAIETADVQAGSLDGELGGRRGKNRRGRDRRRTHGDKKDNRNGNGRPPGAGIGAKDVVLTFYNDTSLTKSYQLWYDGNPAFGSGWARDFGPLDLAAGANRRYQSPTRAAGVWMEGHFGAFWIKILNPLFGAPEVSFRWGGDLEPGVGHTGGAVVGERTVSLTEGQEHTWIVQAHVATVRRENDDKDNKVFTVRLRQTWS